MSIHFEQPIPMCLGAWDSMVQSARAQNAENADAESERQARAAVLTDELRSLIDRGDATALVQGVEWPVRQGVVQAVTLADVLLESVESHGGELFLPVARYLIERAGEGEEQAQSLLESMVAGYVRAWV